MSRREEVFGKAPALEKEYNWLKAADLYEQALLSVEMKDFLKKGEIQERIGLYLDENGKYKSHEPEPVPITVKELGIKGWIKGER